MVRYPAAEHEFSQVRHRSVKLLKAEGKMKDIAAS